MLSMVDRLAARDLDYYKSRFVVFENSSKRHTKVYQHTSLDANSCNRAHGGVSDLMGFHIWSDLKAESHVSKIVSKARIRS
jgi:hypothetical protein